MDFEEVGMIWGWDTDTSMMPLPQTPRTYKSSPSLCLTDSVASQ